MLRFGGAVLVSEPAMPLSFIPPMLPSLAERAPEGAEWLHEIKYDGYRTQVVIEAKTVRAFTRNGHDWSERYQPIIASARALKCRSAILDGEMAAQAPGGVTDFGTLRRSIKGAPERLILFAFDLIHLNGQDLRGQPLIDRRRRLQDLIGAADPPSRLHFSPHHVGNGSLIFKAADEAGLEGIVSKRVDGRYASGRTKTWCKVKSFTVADYAVLGVEQSPTGIPVALLATLGDRAYVGDAMITLTDRERAAFWAAVERLGTPKARLGGLTKRKALWIKSGLIARVRHLKGEEKLRHATLQTLDVREPLPGEIDLSRKPIDE